MYDNSLIVRTTFSPNEFPHDKAFVDQYTSRENVKDIAKMIADVINSDIKGVINVGGQRKTVFDLALKLGRDEMGALHRDEVNVPIPFDTSLNTNKYKELINKGVIYES